MMIVLLSLLISVGVTTLAYWFIERRSRASEVTRVRRRLGLQTEAERLAETNTPSLIRSSERQEPWWMRTLGPRLQINEKLRVLIESAGLNWEPDRVLKQCAVSGLVAAGLVLCMGTEWTAFLMLPAALLAAILPIVNLRRSARKRLSRFEAQFPGALEFIARSMRA